MSWEPVSGPTGTDPNPTGRRADSKTGFLMRVLGASSTDFEQLESASTAAAAAKRRMLRATGIEPSLRVTRDLSHVPLLNREPGRVVPAS